MVSGVDAGDARCDDVASVNLVPAGLGGCDQPMNCITIFVHRDSHSER